MKIILGNLKDKSEELSSFLEPRVGTKPTTSGGELDIDEDKLKEGLKASQVKTYVKRFLFQNGQRKEYRVFVHGTELSLIQLEGEKKEEEAKTEAQPKERATDATKEVASSSGQSKNQG